MSLSAQPTANTAQEREVVPGATAQAPPKPPRSRKWLILLLLPVIGGLLWLAFGRQKVAQQQQPVSLLKTARVTTGPLRQTLRLAGSTSARDFANVVAPMLRGPDAGRALIIMRLVKSGSYVKRGETIVEIDGQAMKDHADDVHAQVLAAEADIRKREAEHAIAMEDLRQELRVAQASYDKAVLDNKTAEVRTSIDVEILKLAVEEEDANYKQLQKNVAITEELHKSELKILAFTRDRHSRHRDRHKDDVNVFNMKAPIGGLAVMNQIWRGGEMGQVQEGDQIAPGQPFMKIVDTASMQLESSVNQVDSEKLRIGQPAIVHFDAFPGIELKGTVMSVGAMGARTGRENYYVRSIPVRVDIHGGDPRIIPDLSASADVILGEVPNALRAPLSAVREQDGRTYVHLKTRDGFQAREVKLGMRNEVEVAIESGLKAGDEVLLGSLR